MKDAVFRRRGQDDLGTRAIFAKIQPLEATLPQETVTVLEPELALSRATPAAPADPSPSPAETQPHPEARHDLDWHHAETERLRVLVEFLNRPIHAHGGTEPDADIITAYNLAVEAALNGIRRAAVGSA
jgi:hypothetical protein